MIPPTCASPIPLATLFEYWLGELDLSREGQFDLHLLGCGHCSAQLLSLVELADQMRAAMRAGEIHVVVTDALVQRLGAQDLRLREYRVPHNGSVYCTITPDDDLLIARLEAPLAAVERLDVEHLSVDGISLERLCDVPFDAAGGEVVLVPRMARIRALPATTMRTRLLAVAPSGERVVSEYTFHHSPFRPGDRA
jgi:hypothetical protein